MRRKLAGAYPGPPGRLPEARVVLDTVLRRLPDLTLAPGESRWKSMIFLRGLEALSLEWRRA
jgi:cytochrome P450